MASTSIKKVAVAGPNGNLGPSVISHLVKAGFDVTLLTRDPAQAAQTYPPPIHTVQTDYSSVSALTTVLRNGAFDALVILINREQPDPQIRLLDAAAAVGGLHVIPSAFGTQTEHPMARQVSAMLSKLPVEEHWLALAKDGALTYTAINTGLFFDWALGKAGLPINLRGGPTMLFDEGKVKLSVSTLDRIGETVAQALLRRDELGLVNRTVYVQSAAVSQSQLLGYAKEIAPERAWPTVALDTASMERTALEKLEEHGETGPEVYRPLVVRASFGLGLGLFERPDNALFGLAEMTEAEIKALLAKYLVN
ncbi:hypothetical protein LTR36_009562 [Oleoguttula mirabilis]|uniref:NmrA-like domain-containing protein n=1 Tax=Oleoguttula mirabilis TaxID=1507867 RepID=A0AAV9JUA4_9PEZI|nr:hypothetical protein LTR36_009562 [Oleoguttula mirabilis]